MEFVKAKTIMTKVKDGNEWYGVDYNMNLYRGCSHGCIYCDSRSECYHIDNFDIVKGKENMLHILENELSKKRLKGVVGIGAMSDTYNPMEIKYQQTRGKIIDGTKLDGFLLQENETIIGLITYTFFEDYNIWSVL